MIGLDKYPDQCVVHRLDLTNGKYLMPKYFKEPNFSRWVESVSSLINIERPYQIVVDEYGEGRIFKERLKERLLSHFKIEIEDNGFPSMVNREVEQISFDPKNIDFRSF